MFILEPFTSVQVFSHSSTLLRLEIPQNSSETQQGLDLIFPMPRTPKDLCQEPTLCKLDFSLINLWGWKLWGNTFSSRLNIKALPKLVNITVSDWQFSERFAGRVLHGTASWVCKQAGGKDACQKSFAYFCSPRGEACRCWNAYTQLRIMGNMQLFIA